MPWTPPTFTPAVVWQNRPNTNTPLSASDLNLEAAAEAAYAAQVGTSVATYFEGGSSPSVPTGQVITAGNLGSAYTIDLASTPNKLVTFTGTLTANCTITIANRAAGCQVYLLITQDGTGGRSLSISDGSASSALTIASTAGALSTLLVTCPDSANIDVSVLGASGALTQAAADARYELTGGVLTAGNLGSAYTIDLANTPNKSLVFTGTLNANCTITLANRAAGCQVYLLITQDGTGGHVLSISDGITTSALVVAGNAGSLSTIFAACPDATNLDISVLGASGAPASPDIYASTYGFSSAASAAANTTALQAAVAVAAARKATLVLPDGTFNFNGIQVQNQKGLNIRGAGERSTILNVVANNAIGLDFFGSTGTGDTADIHISDLQVNYTGAGTTAVRFWNVEGFSVKRCYFASDKLAMTVQGSYVGTVEDSQIYVFGSNAGALGALWLGSGKSAPHTGSPTLSGNGDVKFGSCAIQSSNGPAIIIEDNTNAAKFDTCILEANQGAAGAFNGVVEIDASIANSSIGAAVMFERCYQEGSGFGGADFALGSYENHCSRVTINGYESTGSSGMNYAVDVTACDHLILEQFNCGNYALGLVHFRTGYLIGLVNSNKADLRCGQLDNTGATGTPIYVDDDAHISSAYRGPIIRTNTWRVVAGLSRAMRFDAAVVTGAASYVLDGSSVATGPGATALSALAYVYLDPADWGYGPLRVVAQAAVNNVAPGSNVAFGLVPALGAPAGGATAVTQANGAFTQSGTMTSATLALNSAPEANTNAFYVTTPGRYALAISPVGAFAANSAVAIALRLEAMN